MPTEQLIPIPATAEPPLLLCPSGTGPGGITAKGYTPQDLTQEQRQWLFEQFGHSGIAPVGYGGESCTSTGEQPALKACPAGVGEPGGFDPTTLTQQQRNDLYHAFGHNGEAPVGYGGEPCSGGKLTLASFTGNTSTGGQTEQTGNTTTGGTGTTTLSVDQGMPLTVWSNSAYITAPTGVNIRVEAGSQHAVIGLAGFHGYFELIGGPENGWYQIRMTNGQVGWVSGEYVQIKSITNIVTLEPDFSGSIDCADSAKLADPNLPTQKLTQLCEAIPGLTYTEFYNIVLAINDTLDSKVCLSALVLAYTSGTPTPYLINIPNPAVDIFSACYPVGTDLIDLLPP